MIQILHSPQLPRRLLFAIGLDVGALSHGRSVTSLYCHDTNFLTRLPLFLASAAQALSLLTKCRLPTVLARSFELLPSRTGQTRN